MPLNLLIVALAIIGGLVFLRLILGTKRVSTGRREKYALTSAKSAREVSLIDHQMKLWEKKLQTASDLEKKQIILRLKPLVERKKKLKAKAFGMLKKA